MSRFSVRSAELAPIWISIALVLIALGNVVLAVFWIVAPHLLQYDGAAALASAVALLTGTFGGLGEYQRRTRDRFERRYRDQLRTSQDLADLVTEAINIFKDITRTDYNQVMLVHHEGYTSSLYVVADSIAPGKQRYRRTSFKGLVGQVVGDGRPIRASNVKKLDRYMSAVPSTEAELIVPICSPDGAPVGVLNSESDSSGHFTHGMEIRSEALALAIGSLLPEVHWSSVQPVSTLPQLK